MAAAFAPRPLTGSGGVVRVRSPFVTLDDAALGRWLVHTEASTYLVDMDARQVTRTPGQLASWPAAPLRLDHEVVRLLEVVGPARVGWPMIMRLDIRGDGVDTWRSTTPVVSVHAEGARS